MPSTQKRVQIRPLTIVLILVAIACVVAGGVYLTTAAKSLPAFFPGHDKALAGKHTKHGLAMFSLAVLALIGAWFTTSPGDAS